MTSHEILLELKCVAPNVDRDATGALRAVGVMTRPRTASDIALIVLPIASSSAESGQGYTPGVPKAFPKRSPLTGLAQQASCSSECREIMTRRKSSNEVPELLTHCLIGKSTGQGVERAKFQPARPLR